MIDLVRHLAMVIVAAAALELPIACEGTRNGLRHSGAGAAEEAVAVQSKREPAPPVVFPSEPIEAVRAPFPMPEFVRPKFPLAVFDIRDFGAHTGSAKNTAAIRQAIQQAARMGGGTVLVPPGRWLTGPIRLLSNINLYLAPGAELLFSQDIADYLPAVFTRWEGTEVYSYSPLIYAKDCQNVAITGGGTLDGQGSAWWPRKQNEKAAAQRLYDLAASGVPPELRVFGGEGGLRPSFVQTVGCTNVLIEGVTIKSGPFWTIHPLYSENVIVRRVRVETEGPNTDGCDPDSSKNVLIEDSFFDTGDDAVVIKSGLNEDGWRVGRASENIVVRRLHAQRGHGGVVIGSEMSGGVKNVWVTDSEFNGTDRGLRIKSMRGRGGTIENVFYENVKHDNLRLMAVELTTFYGSANVKPKTERPPTIRGIHIKNLSARGGERAFDIVGLPELPIQDVTFENVEIASRLGARCIDCQDVRFSSVKITPQSGRPFQLDGARGLSFDDTCTGAPSACVEQVGRASSGIRIAGQED